MQFIYYHVEKNDIQNSSVLYMYTFQIHKCVVRLPPEGIDTVSRLATPTIYLFKSCDTKRQNVLGSLRTNAVTLAWVSASWPFVLRNFHIISFFTCFRLYLCFILFLVIFNALFCHSPVIERHLFFSGFMQR